MVGRTNQLFKSKTQVVRQGSRQAQARVVPRQARVAGQGRQVGFPRALGWAGEVKAGRW